MDRETSLKNAARLFIGFGESRSLSEQSEKRSLRLKDRKQDREGLKVWMAACRPPGGRLRKSFLDKRIYKCYNAMIQY